jgi:PIN domain nuclease of toxin-antitoxin system
MTLLLDTHAFLWFWWADPQLSANATAASYDPANRKLMAEIVGLASFSYGLSH